MTRMEFQIVSLSLQEPDAKLMDALRQLVAESHVQVTAQYPSGVAVEGGMTEVLDLADRLQRRLREVGVGEVATDVSIDSSKSLEGAPLLA